MFYKARKFNCDVYDWDVSKEENMSCMFYKAESFNGNVSNWDVSKVTDMRHMFAGATGFNGNVSAWKVPCGADLDRMFDSAERPVDSFPMCFTSVVWVVTKWTEDISVGFVAGGGRMN